MSTLDELLSAEKPRTLEPAQKTIPGSLDELLSQPPPSPPGQAGLNLNLARYQNLTPEQEARHSLLAQKSGLPLPVVRKHEKEVETLLMQRALTNNPNLQRSAGVSVSRATDIIPQLEQLAGISKAPKEGAETPSKRSIGATGSFAPDWKDWATSYLSSFRAGITKGFDSPEYQQELSRYQEIDKQVAEPVFEKAGKIAAAIAIVHFGVQTIKSIPELFNFVRAHFTKPLTPQQQLETARYLREQGFEDEAKTIKNLAKKFPEIFDQLVQESRGATRVTPTALLPAPPGAVVSPPPTVKFPTHVPPGAISPIQPPAVGAPPAQVALAVPPAAEVAQTTIISMMQELEIAETGRKFFREAAIGGAPEVTGVKSTYPNWYRQLGSFKGGKATVQKSLQALAEGTPPKTALDRRLQDIITEKAPEAEELISAPREVTTGSADLQPGDKFTIKGEEFEVIKRTPEEITGGVQGIERKAEITPGAVQAMAPKPLAEEARKFKTAEEFLDRFRSADLDKRPISNIPINKIDLTTDFAKGELAKAQKQISEGTARAISKEPVRIFFHPATNRYEMVDGFHRLVNAQNQGKTEIRAGLELAGSDKQLTDFFNQVKGIERADASGVTKPEVPPPPAVPVGKPFIPGAKATPNQVKQSHVIARDKGWLSSKGKVKPQYRRLAEAMTGKKSIAKMTQAEAKTFIDALKKVPGPEFVAGKMKIASIPLTRKITPAGFFDRNFKEPTGLDAISPSNRYAYVLGVHDLIEPSIKANTAKLLEQQVTHEWLDEMNKLTNKLAKTSSREKAKARLKNIPTEAESRVGRLLNQFETSKEAGLTGDEAKIFTELRKLTNVVLDRTNIIREKVGLEPIKKLDAYLPHFADVLGKKQLAQKYPFPEEIKYWLNFVNPKHIFNPTAFHRTVEDFEGREINPFKLLKAMVSIDLKQIYLEQPNILFREQLNALAPQMPSATRHWVEAYMREVIKGYPTKLDNKTNASLDAMGITKMIDAVLKPFGRGLGHNPAKEISGVINRLVHDAVIWGKVRLVIRNHTQKLLALGLYDTKAFMKAMLPAPPELKAALEASSFLQISQQQFLERLPEGALGKLEKIGYKPYGHSHKSNVLFTGKVAWYAGVEMEEATKHLSGNEKWTRADTLKEVDYGTMTAQFWYNLMGMPSLYRSGITRTGFTLQSWPMNYAFYWREMLTRAFKGKTGWGKPLVGKIGLKWRLGALRHIVASLLFVEGVKRAFGLDYRRTALLGVLPAYLSPPAQIVSGLWNYIAADSDWQRKKAVSRILWSVTAFVPGSGAWRDYSQVWEGKKPIRALFFYTEPIKSKQKKQVSVFK